MMLRLVMRRRCRLLSKGVLAIMACISMALLPCNGNLLAQSRLPLYKDALQPVSLRVDDLLHRMTTEEKFWQCFMVPGEITAGNQQQFAQGIFGLQVNTNAQSEGAAAQLLSYNSSDDALALVKRINQSQKFFVEKTRLGIPIIAFDEALHGLVRGGATAFPQAIGLAATWDTSLMHNVAHAIALETKARGIRQILSPVLNLATDVRWGRTEETYGEDPFLTASMAVAFISAFEQMGIVTTPKHFLANTGDGGRDSYPIAYSHHYLKETHLVPFKAAIEKGGARSLMTAYNSIDGAASTANRWLLTDLLKKEWGFTGFVISDAGATGGTVVLHNTAKDYPESGAQAINAGLDVIFQTDVNHHALFDPAFYDGRVDTAILNDAVRRVLQVKFALGLFENPYVDEGAIANSFDVRKHRLLAEAAAQKSLVLLQNDGTLPLSDKHKKIALIGEEASAARLGGYSGPGNNPVSILAGLQLRLKDKATVSFAPGYSSNYQQAEVVENAWLFHEENGKKQNGLKAAYYGNTELAGVPVHARTDAHINFKWTLFAPFEKLRKDHYSVRWTGMLQSPVSGRYKLGLEGNDGYRLYLNNELVIDRWEKQSYHTQMVPVDFVKDKPLDIRVEFREMNGNATIRLLWTATVDAEKPATLLAEAVQAARDNDVAVIVAGIHEGEFQDRASLALDEQQEELIAAVAAVGKPTIVLLVGGSAVTMEKWRQKVGAIAMVWYPGETGGYAVADMLMGNINPAGRLPVSFPVSEAQLPLSYWHKPTGRGDDYHNLSGLPLFPFGFGLSYTQFAYSNMELVKATIDNNETTRVYFTLTNTGHRDGDEVAQLYIRDELASISQPVMELQGFQRVQLKAGEQRRLFFDIGPEQLQMLNATEKWVVEPGMFRIMIGGSSRNLPLKTDLEVLEN